MGSPVRPAAPQPLSCAAVKQRPHHGPVALRPSPRSPRSSSSASRRATSWTTPATAPGCPAGRARATLSNPHKFVTEWRTAWQRPKPRPGPVCRSSPAPPVAALQPHGRVRRPARDPDHRPRRRLLCVGRARQPLPRRPQRAVLREHRPRPPGRRPGGRRPGPRAGLLHELVLRASQGDRARRANRRAGPGDLNRVFFTERRLGGGRVGAKIARQYHKLRGHSTRRRSSPATSPTTARRSARSARPASPRCARRSSRSPPAAATCRTPTSTA